MFKAFIFMLHLAQSTPQFFGQSYSSSSYVDPSGAVVSNTIYTDSDGNRIINGENNPINTAPAKTVIPSAPEKPKPDLPKTVVASRPDWDTGSKNPVSSGAYVPDNRGQYKPKK